MSKNVFAHTDATPPAGNPAYISINEVEPGRLCVTVRTEHSQMPSEIVLGREKARELYVALMHWLIPTNAA